MKNLKHIITAFLILLLTGCSPYWVQQAEKVKLGMTRPQVEKYLPVYKLSPTYVYADGDTVVCSYWVDPKWKVTVYYNFKGMPKTGTYEIDWSKSDSVQVIGLPEIDMEKMLEIKPIKINTGTNYPNTG